MEITESLFKNKNMSSELSTVEECKKEIVEVMCNSMNYAKEFNSEQDSILKEYEKSLQEYLTQNLSFIKKKHCEGEYKYRNRKYYDFHVYTTHHENGIIYFDMMLSINGARKKYVSGSYVNVNIPDMDGCDDICGVKICSIKNKSTDDDIWLEETKEYDITEWNRYVDIIYKMYDEDIQTRIDEGITIYVEYIEIENKKYKCDKIYKNLVEVFKNCVLDNYEDNEV